MYDVIVVGGGIIGSWTAYHLLKARKNVLLLEQFPLPHTRGSSHGQTRMLKTSNRMHHLSNLIAQSKEDWKTLENESGMQLIRESGCLSIAESRLGVIKGLSKGLQKVNEKYTLFQGNEIRSKFPGLNFDENFEGIYEQAYVLRANQSLTALWNQIKKNGGVIKDGEAVTQINVLSPKEVQIKTHCQSYYAKSVVLACGPWITQMTKHLKLKINVQAVRVITNYWKEKEISTYSSEQSFPNLLVMFKEYHVYSTPADEYHGFLKVCYHYRAPVDPNQPDIVSQNDVINEAKRLDILKEIIKTHFPQLECVPSIKERNLQSITPTNNCILDTHPEYKNVVIGAGFSGMGFAISPATGRILADLTTNKTPSYDLSFYSIKNNAINANL